MDNHLIRAISFIMEHYASVEVTRKRNKRTTQVTLQVPSNCIQNLFSYLIGQGMSPEAAVNTIKICQQSAMRSAPSRNKSFPIVPLIYLAGIVIILSQVPFFSAEPVVPRLLLVIAPLLALLMLFYLSPRSSAMEAVWRSHGLPDRDFDGGIAELIEVSRMSFWKLLFTRQRMVAIVCILIPALTVVGSAGYIVSSKAMADSYHEAMTANGDLLSSAGSGGTRFTVFDMETERYVRDYLPSNLCAKAPEDVRGVIIMELDSQTVGVYSSYGGLATHGGSAKQYVVNLSLYDCAQGMLFGQTETILGGDPPSSVRSSNLFESHYGSKPSDAEIREACLRLIDKLNSSYSSV